MLFRKFVLAGFAVVGVALGAAYFFHLRDRPSDAARYRKLIQESSQFRSRHALERHPAHQTREGVQKDIWAVDKGERLHFRLKGAHSELTVMQKKDKVEAIEDLQGIHCWIQEEIDPAAKIQQVRTLTAAVGTYHYPTHRFFARSVHLAFYRIPGLDLPSLVVEKPFLTGVAQEATFGASGKFPTFTAYQITAQIDPDFMSSP